MNRAELRAVVLDLKKVREAVYDITNQTNPWTRKQVTDAACSVIHDVTEEYKKKLREADRKKK